MSKTSQHCYDKTGTLTTSTNIRSLTEYNFQYPIMI